MSCVIVVCWIQGIQSVIDCDPSCSTSRGYSYFLCSSWSLWSSTSTHSGRCRNGRLVLSLLGSLLFHYVFLSNCFSANLERRRDVAVTFQPRVARPRQSSRVHHCVLARLGTDANARHVGGLPGSCTRSRRLRISARRLGSQFCRDALLRLDEQCSRPRRVVCSFLGCLPDFCDVRRSVCTRDKGPIPRRDWTVLCRTDPLITFCVLISQIGLLCCAVDYINGSVFVHALKHFSASICLQCTVCSMSFFFC